VPLRALASFSHAVTHDLISPSKFIEQKYSDYFCLL